jgi:hypothetical protein
MFGLTCACCGADITAPQFHNGKAYGWTCIKKVNPQAKQVKNSGVWVKADSLVVIPDCAGSSRGIVKATINGTTFSSITYRIGADNDTTNIRGGLVRLLDEKGLLCWKGLDSGLNYDEKGQKHYKIRCTRTNKVLFEN